MKLYIATWCVRHNICSAWFLDIRISTCSILKAFVKYAYRCKSRKPLVVAFWVGYLLSFPCYMIYWMLPYCLDTFTYIGNDTLINSVKHGESLILLQSHWICKTTAMLSSCKHLLKHFLVSFAQAVREGPHFLLCKSGWVKIYINWFTVA